MKRYLLKRIVMVLVMVGLIAATRPALAWVRVGINVGMKSGDKAKDSEDDDEEEDDE